MTRVSAFIDASCASTAMLLADAQDIAHDVPSAYSTSEGGGVCGSDGDQKIKIKMKNPKTLKNYRKYKNNSRLDGDVSDALYMRPLASRELATHVRHSSVLSSIPEQDEAQGDEAHKDHERDAAPQEPQSPPPQSAPPAAEEQNARTAQWAKSALADLENRLQRAGRALASIGGNYLRCCAHATRAASQAADIEEDEAMRRLDREMVQCERLALGAGTSIPLLPAMGSIGQAARALGAKAATMNLNRWAHVLEDQVAGLKRTQQLCMMLLKPTEDLAEDDWSALDGLMGSVRSQLHPDADLESALLRFNGSDADVAPQDREGVAGKCLQQLMIRMDDVEDDDEGSAASEREPDSEPFYAVSSSSRRAPSSATAQLGFRDEAVLKILRAVVDSGAARSGMRLSFLQQHFPNHFAAMRPTSLSFHDANGHNMATAGEVDFTLQIGQCAIATTFVVFHKLAVPILLGVNSFTDGGLVQNFHCRQLYVDPSIAGSRHCSVDLEVEKRDSGATLCSIETHSDCTSHCMLHYDCDQHSVRVKRCDACAVAIEEAVPCEPTLSSATPRWSTRVIAARDYVIPAGAKCFGLLLEYATKSPRANMDLEMTIDGRFADVLVSHSGAFSAYNANCFAHVHNRQAAPLRIRKGEDVGVAVERPSQPIALVDTPQAQAVSFKYDKLAGLPYSEGGPPSCPAEWIDLGPARLSAGAQCSRHHDAPQ